MQSILSCCDKIKAYIISQRKSIIAVYCIYLLALTSLLRANYNYMDDFGRVLIGYRGFDIFSRFIPHYASIVVHADSILNDISPLPQILAAFIMSVTAVILISVFSNNKNFSWLNVAAVMPLGLSPYFLECFSFKFDAPYMALSILASVSPLLFVDFIFKVYFGVVFFCVLIMCMSYQAASGIFVICILFLYAKKWNDGMEKNLVLNGICKSLSAYIVGMLFYRFIILKPFDDYVSTDVFGEKSFHLVLFDNIKTFFSYLKGDATDLWLITCVALCLCFLRSFVAESTEKKYKALLIAVSLLILCSILSYGAFLILQKPLFYPRSMYGIGVFFSIISLLALNNKGVNHLTKVVVLVLAWSTITFSLAYGNCLAEQRRYENFRAQLVLNDLSKLPNMDNKHTRKMQLQGTVGYSPVVHRISKRYKVLERFIHPNVSADFCFGEFYLFHYFNLPGITQVPSWGDEQRTLYEKDLLVFVDTAYHRIKADDRSIIVLLKSPVFENDKKAEK